MIYVVTGRHRTGTSMMMRALSESSGLTPYVDMDIEHVIRSREADADYNPNPNGYYQSDLTDLTDLADDTVVKVTVYAFAFDHLGIPDNVRILQMARDETERATSFERSFGHPEPAHQIARCEQGEALLWANHCDTVRLDYRAVVDDPAAEFAALAGLGWPIDPDVAAALVDPTLHRNRG